MTSIALHWADAAPAELRGGAAAIGNFDGVHRGHRALIEVARRWALRAGGPAVAVTFDPPPYQILFPEAPPRPPLTTFADRAEYLREAGADHVVLLRTTADMLALSPEAFFREVLVRQLGVKAIVEGFNFRFGCNRAGTTETLRNLCLTHGMNFEEVPALTRDGEPISSSRVRAALGAGAVSLAAELLGHGYRIAGQVAAGARRGRTIGFPTANLERVPTVVPGHGVYAVRAYLEADGRAWPAAANIGPNPTFGEASRKIEVHLIGFTGDLYGRTLTVEFFQKLRDTRPFGSVEALIAQLKDDTEQARRIIP